MRFRTAAVFTLLFLGMFLICDSDESGALSGNGVVISEVSPADEAFTLENRGSATVDLKGYTVTDGEGKLTFATSYKLPPGGTLTVSKDKGTDWFNSRPGVMLFTDSHLVRNGSFTLANGGDEVYIISSGTVTDSVCYGTSEGVEGWVGEPIGISSGHYLLRKGTGDSDTAEDWVSTKAGWTNLEYPEKGFDATVYPFSFPEDCGDPVLAGLSRAEEYADISIYLLSSPKVVSLLCQMEDRGVDVRVLVEGSPLGVDISTELSLMRSLTDHGGEVKIINYGGSEHRFSYVHNKYAVIDGKSIIITSENWTQGNIGEYGNRGWGAVIESTGYAEYMERIFENDFSGGWGDVKGLLELYPRCKAYGQLPSVSIGYSFGRGMVATIHPVMSPDNSFSAMERLITGAERRVYAEQMDLGSSFSAVTGSTPVAWLSSAAERGTDVKFILDSSQSNGSAHESYVNLIVSATLVKAIAVDGGEGFDLIHNKGVIADDRVWLGSVNWTENSFLRNRESAVIIDSAEVSEYFAVLFLKDYGTNEFTVEENGLALSVSVIETAKGTMVVMTADGPPGTEYEWSLGDGTVRSCMSNRVLFPSPGNGEYTASVRMKANGLESECMYAVHEGHRDRSDSLSEYALVLAGVCLVLGIVISLLRRRDGGHAAKALSYGGYRPYR